MRATTIGVVVAFALLAGGSPQLAAAQIESKGAAQASVHPLSTNSTIGELLDNPAARAVLQRQLPAIVASPQIAQARDQTLRGIARFAPALLTEVKLKAVDDELAATPGAVSSGRRHLPPALPADSLIPLTLETVPLWEGRAPGALGDRSVDKPTLTIVTSDGATSFGSAVIVAPGGAYLGLASGLEGREVADWFAAHGVTAFVLRYRLTPFGYRHPVQLHDAQRAIRWVRSHAEDYGINPNRIGMVGFSAGGHLTAMAETLFDDGDPRSSDPVERVSSRPDFAVLGYAPVELTPPMLRQTGLTGPNPSPETLQQVSPVSNVTARTPPTFIVQTTTDELVSPLNATRFYDALFAAKVPVEMHVFAEGRHGMGLGMTDPALSVWPALLQNWLEGLGIIGAKTESPR